jgi:chemotaxis protein MotB
MSDTSGQRRRRGDRVPHEEHDAGMERWLLTYADMITLLLALFIVLWSISSVNISKFTQLKQSLSQAFAGKLIPDSGQLLNGGQSILNPQGSQISQPTTIPDATSITTALKSEISAAAGAAETQSLQKLKRQIDAYARSHDLSSHISTTVDERGLVIRLLTDKLLFDTGKAALKPEAFPLLSRIAGLLRAKVVNPVRVEGNTDNVPISTAQFHSNWELSTARATAVLTYLLQHGIPPNRLSVAGYADQRPVAPNSTAVGRAENRRVDLVVIRGQASS